MFFTFFLASLATFRLTRLVTDDKIFEGLRSWIIKESPRKAKTKAKQLITCHFCFSFYLATLTTIYLVYCGFISSRDALLWQPSVWGASVLLNQLFVYLTDE